MMKEKRSISSSTALWLVGLFLCSITIIIALHITTLSPISTSSSSTLSPAPHSHSAQPPPPEKARNQRSPFPGLPSQPESQPSLGASPISCDRSDSRYDLCRVGGPTVVDPTTATFFAMGPTRSTKPKVAEKIQPYPRKFESHIMARIKNVTLILGPSGPPCEVRNDVPALVFSAGGRTGNFWHDFSDGFIPLFITVNTIFPEEEFQIVVTEGPDWWSRKYADLLRVFSKHPIITLKNDNATHCFPSAHLGLISHGFMIINQTLLPNSKRCLHFHDLLHRAYGRHNQTSTSNSKDLASRPRVVVASRSGSTGRVMMNRKQVIKEMRKMGFDVVDFKPTANTSLQESCALISSSHAMIGVHGAALTHSLFLPPGAVLVQIVPIGVEWAAEAFFGRVARQMNLEYMEYKIGVGESSLVDVYGKHSPLLNDPFAVQKKGWPIEIMEIYLRKQNVRLDLDRFKECLKEAYKKAEKFMHKGGGDH